MLLVTEFESGVDVNAGGIRGVSALRNMAVVPGVVPSRYMLLIIGIFY